MSRSCKSACSRESYARELSVIYAITDADATKSTILCPAS